MVMAVLIAIHLSCLPLRQSKACHKIRDNETCPHGKSCKFSHDPEVCKAARQEKGKSKGKGDAKDGSVATPFVPTSLHTDDSENLRGSDGGNAEADSKVIAPSQNTRIDDSYHTFMQFR